MATEPSANENRIKTAERKLLFFDCETGDLDADTSDMVELAWILTDPSGENIIEQASTKVFPLLPVNPDAARVNGYDPDAWAREAVDQKSVLPRVLELAKDAVWAGHNPDFDWRFVSAARKRLGIPWDTDYHHLHIDTACLMWPLLMERQVERAKLGACLAHFGIENTAPHTAYGDVEACRQLFLAQMKLYRGSMRLRDETLRNAGFGGLVK